MNNHTEKPDLAQHLREAKIDSITIIDGYGRTYTSVNPDDVLFWLSTDGKKLKIMHNGDTSHSYTETYADEVELMGYKEGGYVDGTK